MLHNISNLTLYAHRPHLRDAKWSFNDEYWNYLHTTDQIANG